MIYSDEERESKERLQALLDNYRQNVEFCGSKKALKDKYPRGYSKLRTAITTAIREYIEIAMKDTLLPASVTRKDIECLWSPHAKEVGHAIEEFSSDAIFDIIVTYMTELVNVFDARLGLQNVGSI